MDLTPVDKWIIETLSPVVPVAIGESPVEGKPYVIVYPYYLTADETALGLDSLRRQQYQLTIAGQGWEQVRQVQGWVHARLLSSAAWANCEMVAGATMALAQAIQKNDETTWSVIENLEVMVTDQ